MNTLISDFAVSSKSNNIKHIESLLSDNGIFEIQDANLDIIEVGKTDFLDWYQEKLNTTAVTEIFYDKCNKCVIGNPVILLNCGSFPRTIKDDSERSKTGLMIEVKEDKITYIKFCFVFEETENKYVFECIGAKIKELMNQGYSFESAFFNAHDEQFTF